MTSNPAEGRRVVDTARDASDEDARARTGDEPMTAANMPGWLWFLVGWACGDVDGRRVAGGVLVSAAVEREHTTARGVPKKGWTDRRHAGLIAKAMQDEGKHVEVYRCGVCAEWHVGRPPRVVTQRG